MQRIATRPKMHGEIRARRLPPRGCSFVSVGETWSAQPPSRHSRDGLFPQAISVISLFSPWCPMGVSPVLLLLFRRLARENALQDVRYRCIAKIILAAVSPDADDDEKDDDDDAGCHATTSSATRNYRAPLDIYLIRCDVVYAGAASRVYVYIMCACVYICICLYNA